MNETQLEREFAADFSYYWVIPVTFVASLILMEVVSPKLFESSTAIYSEMSGNVKGEVRAGFLSTIHSVVVLTGCLYTMWSGTSQDIFTDNIWGSSPVAQICMAIVIGYLSADYIILWWYYRDAPDIKFFVVHHAASIIAYAYSMTFHACVYFSNYRLLAEMSTPFVNMRRILEIFKHSKTDPIYVANGWALAVTFFISRIAIFPHYYYKMYSAYNTDTILQQGYTLQYVLVCSSCALDLLNILWFYKICRGAYKIVRIQLAESQKKVE